MSSESYTKNHVVDRQTIMYNFYKKIICSLTLQNEHKQSCTSSIKGLFVRQPYKINTPRKPILYHPYDHPDRQ